MPRRRTNQADGLLVGGRYRLLAPIGAGGSAHVWRAVDEVLGRPVAVKVLRADAAHDAGFRERFRREAKAAAALAHPGIAVVHDYGEQPAGQGELAWLVMELVDGPSLSTLSGRALPEPLVLDVVRQVAEALAAAHEHGVVHRDVKPGNLLLRRDGVVKVTDFGIARVEADSDDPLTQTGVVLGTARYLSPEQASGRTAGPPADVYALGAVAHELLSGGPVFTRDSAVATALAHAHDPPPSLPSEVSPGVARLVTAMLAKDPAARPDAAAVAAEARRLVHEAGAEPDPSVLTALLPAASSSTGPGDETLRRTSVLTAAPPTVPSAAGRRARRPAPVLAAAGGLVLGLALVAGAVASLDRDPSTATPSAATTVQVPSLVGAERPDAVDRLRARGLQPDVRRRESAGDPAGTVLAQRPAAGAQVEPGAVVRLVVAARPEPAEEQPAQADQRTVTGPGAETKPEPKNPRAKKPKAKKPKAKKPKPPGRSRVKGPGPR